jgi:lipopolysaccharide export system protein LptA
MRIIQRIEPMINKYCFISIFILVNMVLSAKTEQLNLQSDHGFYKEVNNQKIFMAQGNAHILIDKNDIFCEEMEIYLNKDDTVDKAIFKKKIRIFQDNDEIQIGGEYAEYYKKDKIFSIRENTFYIDVKEEVAVFGDSIQNYDKEKVAIVQGNVRIFQKEIFAKGAFVKYTRNDKQMEISGFPTIENQGSEYSAKKIFVDVDNSTFILEGGLQASILNEEKDVSSDEGKPAKKETVNTNKPDNVPDDPDKNMPPKNP